MNKLLTNGINMFGFKFLSNLKYAQLKNKEILYDKLSKDIFLNLSFEKEAELLYRISEGTQKYGCRSDDANEIKKIATKWLDEICIAYNNEPFKKNEK